jgi:proteasome accessory factor B
LRRRAADCQPLVDDWDVVAVRYADPGDLAAEVAGYGADAVVLEPEDVRSRAVAHLRAVAGVSA